MPNYNGQLNVNEIYATIFNMIISQQVFADNVFNAGGTLADRSRVDGGLYGDTKLYYATKILKSYEWLGDEEAQNLLKIHRAPNPDCQAITINRFRIIPLTTDSYLSKRAWSTEGAFSSFNSQLLAWMEDTKRVYDATLFNTFVGTHVAGLDDTGKGAAQNVSIPIPAETDGADDVNTEAYNRLVAQAIAAKMADLLVDLQDVRRDFNDYGNVRSYDPSKIVFVWNSAWVNKIRKLDVPTIFNNENLVDRFAENVLPSRYFGNVNKNAGTTSATNTIIRSLIEIDFNEVEVNKLGYDESKHLFPGDLWPDNTPYEEYQTYSEDPNIAFKAYHEMSIPFMTAFRTGTNFVNPRSLTDTSYLIWGYNELEHLKNYPFITAKTVQAG